MAIQIKRGLVIFWAIVLTLSALVPPCAAYLQTKGDWNESQSEHFLVYSHPEIPNKYVREFTQKCEHYYQGIAARLGFSRLVFWTPEDKPKIFIYKEKRDFLKTASRERLINTFYFDKDFFDLVFPRRLTSILLRDFIGPGIELPLWFEQGFACANEKDSGLRYVLLAKALVDKKQPLAKYFYARAASIAIFLLEDYGSENFVRLCRYLREGRRFYEAMDQVYKIKDEQALEAGLRAFLESKTYE